MTSSLVEGRSGSDKLSEFTRSHPSLVALGRAGSVAKGVVYGVVGILAIPIAINGLDTDRSAGSGDEASQAGAIGKISESAWGVATLWLVAVGLLLYVIWRLVSIVLPADNSVSVWATRAGYVVSVVVYSALAWTAISFARHRPSTGTQSGEQSEDARVEQYTRDLMEMPAGRWLVGLIGVAVIGVGGYFVRRGATASFRDELDSRGVGPISHTTIVRLGQFGWVGRGVMMLLVGWFVVQAALHFDPDDAHGIDGALRDATSSPFGAVLVVIVAAGLLVYGAFCVISAPRARLTGAD